MNGQGGGFGLGSVGSYVGDLGFWVSVVIVSIGVNLVFHMLKLPGSRS